MLTSLVLAGCAGAKPDAYRVYFGTSAKGEERGIYMAELDMESGKLSAPVRVSEARRPGFIAIHPDGKHLYATGEGGNAEAYAKSVAETLKLVVLIELLE